MGRLAGLFIRTVHLPFLYIYIYIYFLGYLMRGSYLSPGFGPQSSTPIEREAGMDTDAVSFPADLRNAPDLFGLALGWPKSDPGLL